MNDQIDIGYIDHFDETFDYSYADEDIAYKQIYEMHHCVSIPEETFSLWGKYLSELPTCFCSVKHPGSPNQRFPLRVRQKICNKTVLCIYVQFRVPFRRFFQ